jgi:histidine ammonia-lyase
MGANAATKAYKVVQNVYTILAIELITAAQALTFRRPLQTSPYLEDLVNTFRQTVPFIEDDRVLHDDIQNAEKFLKALELPA